VAAERTQASSGIGRKPGVGPLRDRFTLSRDPAVNDMLFATRG
jgi:hypothetical protein